MKHIRFLSVSAIAALLLISCKTAPTEQQVSVSTSSSSITQSSKSSVTAEWTVAQFPSEGEYRHSFDAMVPPGWTFNCCGDMDHASAHHFVPANAGSDAPYPITITDFAMVGCANGEYQCAIDAEQVPLTPAEFYKRVINYLERGGEFNAVQTPERIDVITAANFSGEIPLYVGTSIHTQQSEEFYVLQNAKGVFVVTFHQPANYDAGFRKEFLDRLK